MVKLGIWEVPLPKTSSSDYLWLPDSSLDLFYPTLCLQEDCDFNLGARNKDSFSLGFGLGDPAP